MADRLDVLGPRPERREAFSGQILAPVDDAVLDKLVEDASTELNAPIALVSLVLDGVQYFRAHVGLPPDLAAARGTARDVSFCQLVVRDDETLLVRDAPHDERVPQALVDSHGIRAYAGSPLRVGGQVLGTLCVIDTKERDFDAAAQATLESFAERASERLGQLARTPADGPDMLGRAAEPAFGELRNLVIPLTTHVEINQLTLAELTPIMSALRWMVDGPAVELAERADELLSELRQTMVDITRVTPLIWQSLEAIEALVMRRQGEPLEALVDRALRLAHHVTKLGAGVQVEGVEGNRSVQVVDAQSFVCVLAFLLAGVAEAGNRTRAPVRVVVEVSPRTVSARVDHGHVAPDRFEALAVEARKMAGLGSRLGVEATTEGGIWLRTPR